MSGVKHLNHNKQFLVGVAAMSFAVLFVVIFFLSLSFEKMEEVEAKGFYQLELAQGFVGDSTQIYVNDSLLYENVVATDTLKITFKPFDEQHLLMVSDLTTQRTRSYNLPKETCRVILSKDEEGLVEFLPERWENE